MLKTGHFLTDIVTIQVVNWNRLLHRLRHIIIILFIRKNCRLQFKKKIFSYTFEVDIKKKNTRNKMINFHYIIPWYILKLLRTVIDYKSYVIINGTMDTKWHDVKRVNGAATPILAEYMGFDWIRSNGRTSHWPREFFSPRSVRILSG